MTIPTLYHFMEAIKAPDLAFASLYDIRPVPTGSGEPILVRTSRFAEALIEWQGRRALLCFPLSAASIFAVEQMAAKLKYLPTDLLTPYSILRDEMSYGDGGSCDVILHLLPEGEPLSACVDRYDTDSLLTALNELEQGMKELGFVHNNLKTENIIATGDGHLIPIRYHFARFEHGSDAGQFEELRTFVRARAGGDQVLHDTEAPAYHTLSNFPGHRFVGEMSDQLVRVEDKEGYGFVDTSNRVVIPAQFHWADDFHEGRAEVQTAEGQMGLIDKSGRYVIEPRYEIVDYNPYTGCSRVRLHGLWALADYNGKIGEFTPRYIEENEYVA